MKKKIQSDFGIFEYEGHIVAATHVGILNLGLEMEDLPNTSKEISEALSNLVFSVGHQIGLYLGHISQLPEFAMAEPVTAFDYRLRDTLLRYRDENAQRFLAKIFEGAGLEDLNFSLLVFLIAINYLVYLVSNVVRYSPTVFKMRYLALYHIVSSLKKLQSYYFIQEEIFQVVLKDFLEKCYQIRHFSFIRVSANLEIFWFIMGLKERCQIQYLIVVKLCMAW